MSAAVERAGEPGRIARADEQRGVADDLLHRRAGGGHERPRRTRAPRARAGRTPPRATGRRPPRPGGRTRAARRRPSSRPGRSGWCTPLRGRRVADRDRAPAVAARRSRACRSGWSGAMRANASMSVGTSLRGSSVAANARYGGRMPIAREPRAGRRRRSGVKRSWSTPCGATITGAVGASTACSRSRGVAADRDRPRRRGACSTGSSAGRTRPSSARATRGARRT